MKSTKKTSRAQAIALFLIYLQKNGVYTSFVDKCGRGSIDETCVHLNRMEPRQFFSGAFPWMDTPEGFRYWAKMDAAWRYVCSAFKF